MNARKIALIALLAAVIAVAAVFTVKRIRTELQAPTMFVDQKFDKVDMKSFKVFAETNADWTTQYAPDASGRWKNPETGEYTMVSAIRCASCGRLIPAPEIPAELQPGKGTPRKEYAKAMEAAAEKVLSDYKCPICGKNAWFPPAPKAH